MSTPTRSISSNGPIRKPPSIRTMRSIVSMSAIRSCSSRSASRPNGPVAAVDEEAGPVAGADHGLAHRLAGRVRERERRSEDCSPATTSSSLISGAGLKKCMPTTRSGLLAAAAIAVTSSEEVLLASTQSALDDLRELRVELVLELDALGHGLDHELARRERLRSLPRAASRRASAWPLLAQLALGGFFAQPVARALQALLQGRGHRVVQQRSRAGARGELGDAGAHRPGAEHADHGPPLRPAGSAGLRRCLVRWATVSPAAQAGTIAPIPVISRPMISFWICEVPS